MCYTNVAVKFSQLGDNQNDHSMSYVTLLCVCVCGIFWKLIIIAFGGMGWDGMIVWDRMVADD